MKKTVFAALMAILCLCGNALGQVYNRSYYFKSSSIPNYKDLTTVKATEQVNRKEIISVGFANELQSITSHDIVVVKTDAITGDVIWSHRYGHKNMDEKAYGLDVTYDEKDVIVVGSSRDLIGNPGYGRDAFAMRIEIATGNVVWSVRYGGRHAGEEWKMIEKANLKEGKAYFLAGCTAPEGYKSVLFTGLIDENGKSIYLRQYRFDDPLIKANDYVKTMIQNHKGNFMLSGHRVLPSPNKDVFSLGINPSNGAISDKFLVHALNGVGAYSNSGGAIEQVIIGQDRFYALTFTTASPNIHVDAKHLISVILLDEGRNSIWMNYYWQEDRPYNNGLSIYQSRENKYTLDVYTNTSKDQHFPGFLNLKLGNGYAESYIQYEVRDEDPDKLSTAMVQTAEGYIAKALNFKNMNGYMHAATDGKGATKCAEEKKINRKEGVENQFQAKYLTEEYDGTYIPVRPLPGYKAHGALVECDGKVLAQFRLASTTDPFDVEQNEAFQVYPNPIGNNGEKLLLSYSAISDKAVELSIFNALGQQTGLRLIALTTGTHQIALENKLLSPGLNLITIRSEGKILFQARVVKQ